LKERSENRYKEITYVALPAQLKGAS